MPPKRSAPTTTRKSPSKRLRSGGHGGGGGIGAYDPAKDGSARLVQAGLLAERAGGGQGYLSTRARAREGPPSLREAAVQVAARGLFEQVRITPRDATGTGRASGKGTTGTGRASLVGWNPDRTLEKAEETKDLGDFLQTLPVEVNNRLLRLVLDHAAHGVEEAGDQGVGVLAVAALFFHSSLTHLSLSAATLTSPAVLISRIPLCTALTDLNLSFHTSVTDKALAKVLSQLSQLEKLNLKGCTRVGDESLIATSKVAEGRLRSVNLSLTAVTVKGLTSLLARCANLEVLKLASVAGLNEKNVTKLVTDATEAAFGWRHFPLSRLHTLKLRSTDITDSSLGRLLTLCGLTLSHLDVSFSSLKSLDFISSALHALPEWKLEKLVASGLPLSPTTLERFFAPLAARPDAERRLFKVLKLGSIPASSTKAPGLTDAVLAKILPYLEKLDGLESVGLHANWGLGKTVQPLSRFIEVVGRRCLHLDLTLPVESHHLEGLLPPLASADSSAVEPYEPPRLQTLVLDSSRITDTAAGAISACRDLRALHVAETRISTKFLATVLSACSDLTSLNLTSCRGVPVTQRRNFFEAWEAGNVAVTP